MDEQVKVHLKSPHPSPRELMVLYLFIYPYPGDHGWWYPKWL